MSNLLKRTTIIDKDTRVIDYNKVIEEKIAAIRNATAGEPDGFAEGLHTQEVEQLVDEDGNPIDMSIFGSDFVSGLPDATDSVQQHSQEIDIDAVKSQADAMLEDAQVQAEQIVNEANGQADAIRQEAYEEGINSGMADAEAKIADMQAKLEAEYNLKKDMLQKEYDERKAEMEPELVDVILEVFKNVTHAITEDNQEIIISLVNHVLQDANINNDFVIKVSADDYSFMVQNQGKLYMAMNKDIQVDIVEDSKLSKGQCLIEADSGVYDCSLDIQLDNLIKEIKILSCG